MFDRRGAFASVAVGKVTLFAAPHVSDTQCRSASCCRGAVLRTESTTWAAAVVPLVLRTQRNEFAHVARLILQAEGAWALVHA
jgi:hypothetical protein